MICGKQSGELQPIPISTKTWDIFSIDFIIGLPESVEYGRPYSTIFVFVDKLFKMCHYISCYSDMTARKLAEVINWEVIRFHGVFLAIISDYKSFFTSRFWANLMYSVRIERRLSTAIHPQIDGQTERHNSVFKQYLCSYINYQQDDRASFLALAKFAYNAAIHLSTRKTPFEMCIEKCLDQICLPRMKSKPTVPLGKVPLKVRA